MSWWKTAIYDTCSLITLDKILQERRSLSRYFPKKLLALEVSLSADQMYEETAERMRELVEICEPPPLTELASLLSSAGLPKSLSDVDKLVFATAVHAELPVVTGDRRLAKVVRKRKLEVGDMALILKELVHTKKLNPSVVESLLQGLADRKDYLLVSFAVYKIPNIGKALVRAAKRGVQLTVIVETPDKIEGEGEYSTIKALGQEVAACSTVYFWPKDNRPLGDNDKVGIMHVKCAVADGEWLFLSSANLTQQAFTINMELGMLVRGGTMPKRVEQQFDRLIQSGQLKPV